jgi:hypothetical protein
LAGAFLSIHTLANTGGHFEYLLTFFLKNHACVRASAADRPSPVALAKAACAVAAGKEPPADYPGKT